MCVCVCVCVYNVCVFIMCVCVCVCVAGPSLGHFLCAELTRGYYLENDEAKFTERRERVYSCMRIPKELEKVPTSDPPPLTSLMTVDH